MGLSQVLNSIIAKVNEKVATASIVNNLTSTDTDKPLSANQGKVLKDALDNLPAGAEAYTLPTASNTVLGGVKDGGGIDIDGNGVVTLNATALSTSIDSVVGGYTLTSLT